ncbi:MAG: sigma-70 family RNA polymerase sigma factor, partial [Rhodospirillaceae bacterium]|nr:sigma-70 family RNA polymerase sigma factor [Rhodospirillaceae bacterium]
QKKLFFNLRKMKNKLNALEEGDLSPENVTKIAADLKVAEEDVISMNRRLAAPDNSLNAPLRNDGEAGGEWQDWLVDEEQESQETIVADHQELKARQTMLVEAMKTLNNRERHILTERRLRDEPLTLEELSQEYGVSRERVRQIEVRAFEKLQKTMKNMVIEKQIAY